MAASPSAAAVAFACYTRCQAVSIRSCMTFSSLHAGVYTAGGSNLGEGCNNKRVISLAPCAEFLSTRLDINVAIFPRSDDQIRISG